MTAPLKIKSDCIILDGKELEIEKWALPFEEALARLQRPELKILTLQKASSCMTQEAFSAAQGAAAHAAVLGVKGVKRGDLIAVLNPSLLPKADGADSRAAAVQDEDQILLVGSVKGIMRCGAMTRRQAQCRQLVHTSQQQKENVSGQQPLLQARQQTMNKLLQRNSLLQKALSSNTSPTQASSTDTPDDSSKRKAFSATISSSSSSSSSLPVLSSSSSSSAEERERQAVQGFVKKLKEIVDLPAVCISPAAAAAAAALVAAVCVGVAAVAAAAKSAFVIKGCCRCCCWCCCCSGCLRQQHVVSPPPLETARDVRRVLKGLQQKQQGLVKVTLSALQQTQQANESLQKAEKRRQQLMLKEQQLLVERAAKVQRRAAAASASVQETAAKPAATEAEKKLLLEKMLQLKSSVADIVDQEDGARHLERLRFLESADANHEFKQTIKEMKVTAFFCIQCNKFTDRLNAVCASRGHHQQPRVATKRLVQCGVSAKQLSFHVISLYTPKAEKLLEQEKLSIDGTEVESYRRQQQQKQQQRAEGEETEDGVLEHTDLPPLT
ncbi:hypothetical protein Efla_000862 [Eimeria flavescens]